MPTPAPTATPITIYHNPDCGTSRNTLALIRNSDVEPVVIEYLKTPPARAKLVELIAAMGVPVRSVLRQKGTPFDDLKLGDPHWTDAELVDFMVEHPILMNRPIVATESGTRLCRPSETVLGILPSPQPTPFATEGGEPVLEAGIPQGSEQSSQQKSRRVAP